MSYLLTMKEFLENEGKLNSDRLIDTNIEKRMNPGFSLPIEGHIQAMVYSMLTNQKKWYQVRPHLEEIDTLFFDYNPELIIKKLDENPKYFIEGIKALKCGNRSINRSFSDDYLRGNIEVFQKIMKNSTIDDFMVPRASYDKFEEYDKQFEEIVSKITKYNSPYKLKGFGIPLASEYLRNIGVPDAKPDTHIRRFYSGNRMGSPSNMTDATIEESIADLTNAAREANITRNEADNIIWSYCATGYGEICTKDPKCESCVISSCCKQNQ